MNTSENYSKKFNYSEQKKRKKRIRIIKSLVLLEIAIVIAIIFLLLTGRTNSDEEGNEEIVRLTATSLDHSAWILDGRLYVAGKTYEDQEVAEQWDNLIQVAISDDHIVALDQTGTVYATGSNASLQCGINGLKDVCYIEAGMNCSIGVMKDGTLRIFGIMEEDWRAALEQERKVQTVAMGEEHIVVLHTDGTVTAYGNNEKGQCDVEKWEKIRQVTVGYAFTVGLTEKGRVLFSGDDSYDSNICVTWKNISAIDAGSSYIVGIDKNGNVCAEGLNTQGECNVNAWKKIISASAGYDHTIGLSKDGEIFAVGFNGSGQCDV